MYTTYMDVLVGRLTGVVKYWRKRKCQLHYRTHRGPADIGKDA